MKKIAILTSFFAIAAAAATSWQIHVYNQNVLATRHTLEKENFELYDTVNALQAKINLLTNHPAGAASSKSI